MSQENKIQDQDIEWKIEWITTRQLHSLLGSWQRQPNYEEIIEGVETKKVSSKGRAYTMYKLDEVIFNHDKLCDVKARQKHEKFCERVKNLK
jgi:hypothetical protein